MRQACVELLAEMEARLDFAEELPELDTGSVQTQIAALQERLEGALRTGAMPYGCGCKVWAQ
jgi:tRNA modification GTPase